MSVAWVAVGATVANGVIGASAASDAADAQVQAADKSTALQRDVFNKQVELNDPYRRIGLGAGNKLMTLLGLTPGPAATGLDGRTAGTKTRDQLRSELLSKYTTGATPGTSATPAYRGMLPVGAGVGMGDELFADTGGTQGGQGGTVDEAGLNAEIERQLADQAAHANDGLGDPNDPEFGSLMRDFSMADYQADPGYQFRLDQGNQALERSAAARGGLLSGRAAKDTMAYNQGQASQEYSKAFDRFQVNRSNKLNPLQSLMGVGQTGTGAMTSAAGSYGAGAGANITGAGNATASGIVGGANAWNNAIGQGVSSYQQNQLMKNLFPGGGGGSGARIGAASPLGDYPLNFNQA